MQRTSSIECKDYNAFHAIQKTECIEFNTCITTENKKGNIHASYMSIILFLGGGTNFIRGTVGQRGRGAG